MGLSDILRKVVLPLVTLTSAAVSAFATYSLVVADRYGGAACTALLTAGLSYFVFRDVKALFSK